MEEEYEASPIIPIGDKKYFCVEYPGHVKRPKRAIQTMGGEKALANALVTDSAVELNFRPGDIFSHPIKGQIFPTSKLLVKVTRTIKRNKSTGEVVDDYDSEWKPEVKGIVEKTLRFRALADFQYLVPEDDKIRQLKTALIAGDVDHIVKYNIATDDDNNENIRNIPPPLFTSTEGPLQYGYRQSQPVLRVRVRQPDGSYKVKLINRSRRTGFEITAVKFYEENIPTRSWHNIPSSSKPEEDQACAEVAKLFQERPIWSRFAITNRLAPEYRKHVKTALIRNAYTFNDGPWRDCWVIYGLDPRKDSKYHIYQTVDVRRFFQLAPKDKAPKPSRKSNKKPTEDKDKHPACAEIENLHVFDGKRIPSGSSIYQLCDVTDPDILPMIHNPDYVRPEASKLYGFYYKCVNERIRKSIRTKHISLIETGRADPMHDVEHGLKEEILKEKKNSEAVEVEDEEDEEDMVDTENAVRGAMDEMIKKESSKRLKDVVDDYMDQLTKNKSKRVQDIDEEVDLDELEIFEEDLDEFGEEEEEGNQEESKAEEQISIKVEQVEEEEIKSQPQDEDVIMEDT